MPRAQQMTPAQAYQMAPSRWTTMLKVLQNKKAMNLAFQKHMWEMQKQAEALASGERRQKMAGEYGLREREMMNRSFNSSSLEARVLQEAVNLAEKNYIDLNTPEGQQQFQQIYQTLMNQVTGQGASEAASGMINPSGITITSEKPSMFVNPFDAQDRQNSVMSQWMKKRKEEKSKNNESSQQVSSQRVQYSEGTTAINHQTGERLIYRNGKWQKY